jgi:hypothetical protein
MVSSNDRSMDHTTKHTKDTKDLKMVLVNFFNFVLFVTFVVKHPFEIWLPRRLKPENLHD